MPIDRVVINASPLIVLFKSGQAELLPQLFTEILVPQAVWEEVTIANDIAAQQLPNVSWAKPVQVAIHPSIAAWDLGSGESTVLSFALDNPDYRAMLDDPRLDAAPVLLKSPHLEQVERSSWQNSAAWFRQ